MHCLCLKCGSTRIADVSGKCSDCCSLIYDGHSDSGYVTGGIGIGGGDYLEFRYCLECGQIQDKFPVEDPDFDDV